MNTTTKFCVPLTVYYDKSCPMCATEMHVIQDLDWRGRLKLVDCSAPDFDDSAAAKEGVTREAMMTKLHARDPEGRWLIGAGRLRGGLRVGRADGQPRASGATAGCGRCSTGSIPRWRATASRCRGSALHRLVGALLRASRAAATTR